LKKVLKKGENHALPSYAKLCRTARIAPKYQFDELSDSAYAVTNAIKEFFQEVNAIRHEGENDNEN